MGTHFSAGEVSYITPGIQELPTPENVFGNLNGTPKLCAMYAERKGYVKENITGVIFFEALNAGDPAAREVLDTFTRGIAKQIFNLQTVLDPDKIAIGGGISSQPAFTDSIRRNLQKLYAACPYQIPQAQVVTCKFQNDANLYGAYYFYKKQFI